MSVIPFVSTDVNQSILISAPAFQAIGNTICLLNADPEQIAADRRDSNISYDLRVGGFYRDRRNEEGVTLHESDPIRFLPGIAFIVETEEKVWFPQSILGQTLPKVSLLQKGLSNTLPKADPSYQGHLLVTAFNLGEKSIELKRREDFRSMFMESVGAGVSTCDKPGKRIEDCGQRAQLEDVHDWFEAHLGLFTVSFS